MPVVITPYQNEPSRAPSRSWTAAQCSSSVFTSLFSGCFMRMHYAGDGTGPIPDSCGNVPLAPLVDEDRAEIVDVGQRRPGDHRVSELAEKCVGVVVGEH